MTYLKKKKITISVSILVFTLLYVTFSTYKGRRVMKAKLYPRIKKDFVTFLPKGSIALIENSNMAEFNTLEKEVKRTELKGSQLLILKDTLTNPYSYPCYKEEKERGLDFIDNYIYFQNLPHNFNLGAPVIVGRPRWDFSLTY